MHFYRRVKKALNSASIVFAESSTTKSILSKVYHINAVQMNETGADLDNFSKHDSFCINNIFHILWVGKIQGLKGLPIALQTLAALKNKVKAKMTVIGDGPDEMACRKLTKKLDLDTNVTFLGKIPNVEVRKLMKNNDILFFTSLKEGTPHVVLEALSSGLPVVCHNACGHGDIVNSTCGIKIPMISHNNSITHFTRSLINLYNDKSKLEEFSKGTKLCVEHYSWENKTKTMVEYYKRVASR